MTAGGRAEPDTKDTAYLGTKLVSSVAEMYLATSSNREHNNARTLAFAESQMYRNRLIFGLL